MLDVDATIAVLSEHPERTALFVDFDGTLSPIVEHAEDARALPEAVTQLGRLATRLGRVGIVSGRPVSFLAAQVPLPGLVYAGLYGMERLTDGNRTIDPRIVPHLDAVSAATSEVAGLLPEDLVEPKAGVSVTLHWRPQADRAEEICAIAEDVARRHGLATLRTRMAVELRPPVPIDKGVAVRGFVEGFDVAAFAGDDSGDLPAFASITRAVADGALKRAIRIGVNSPEAPPELGPSVDVLVDGPPGVVDLLARLADKVG